ncbi:hypothetical protein PAJ34TS1_16860 [Paenibacillus azoreducens]
MIPFYGGLELAGCSRYLHEVSRTIKVTAPEGQLAACYPSVFALL